MLAAVLFAAAVLVAGCGGGKSDDNANTAPANNEFGGTTNNNPASLSGKTYSFTVTAAQGLSEPVGSTYTIAFDDSNYTFNPSAQNIERTNSFSSTYTYDPNTATAVLDGVEAVTATFTFSTPMGGTYHFMETDGEMQDGTFNQL
jgi:hypothetical protein